MAKLLPLSFTVKSNLVSYNGAESCKLITCNHSINGKRVDKMNILRHTSSYRDMKEYSKEDRVRNRNVGILAQSRGSIIQDEDQSVFHFRTEVDGLVKIIVTKKNFKYNVSVEVTSSEPCLVENAVVMSWGIYRSDSSQFLPLESKIGASDAKSEASETPFVQTGAGRLALELSFEGTLAPFYLSFLLKSLQDGGSKSLDIRSHRKTRFCIPIGLGRGYPAPFGPSFSPDGSLNFAVFSKSVEGMILCLYDDTNAENPTLEIDLDPIINRSGDIWHVSVDCTIPFVSYGYKCKIRGKGGIFRSKKVILDPYAKIIANSGPGLISNRLGKLVRHPEFNWGNDVFPCLPMEKLVVYRLNPSRFTHHDSFTGIVKKLQHLKDLGVNAILLEPVSSFDENISPYFPAHFFGPQPLVEPLASMNSMKEMVKILHANGMEVLLEVAFTHTSEDCSLKSLDKSSYYYVSSRNALNCNYPVVQQFILDALRYWLVEFHIDGFSFINASSMLKGSHGELLSRPPLIEAIAFDPILSKAKIIADAWDPSSNEPPKMELAPFPHWKRWAEMNSKFCDDVRNFLRGEALLSDLATRLCGSGDIFLNGRGPAFSFNYIAKNSGLSLVDLVSFSSGNELASELSWNCGEEGPTNNPIVLEKRLKQIRNFLFILFVSLGVPVLNMGDEYGQSSGGSYSYGDRLKPFDWNGLRTSFGVQTTQFISFLTSLRRRRSDLFQKRSFLKEENIEWHGIDLSTPDWEDLTSKFLGMTLKVDEEEVGVSDLGADLYVFFNGADEPESTFLPVLPLDMAWYRLVDTALAFPGFFSEDGDLVVEQMDGSVAYEAKSHSCALFEARSIK